MEQLLPGVGADAQIGEFAQQILLIVVEAAHELRVLQFLLALLRGHSAQNTETALEKLFAILWQSLPARRDVFDYFLALLRRQAVEDLGTITHRVLLFRRQLIPSLHAATNSFLLFRRQTLEFRIIPHEAPLLFR